MGFTEPHFQAPSLRWPGRSGIPLFLLPSRTTRKEALPVPYGDQGLPALGRASVDPSAKPKAVSGRAGAKNKPAGAEAGWRLQSGQTGREPGLRTAVAIVLGGAGGAGHRLLLESTGAVGGGSQSWIIPVGSSPLQPQPLLLPGHWSVLEASLSFWGTNQLNFPEQMMNPLSQGQTSAIQTAHPCLSVCVCLRSYIC